MGQQHGNQPQRRYGRRHEHRPQAGQGALIDGILHRFSGFDVLVDGIHHHHAVQHRHAEQRDEADGTGHRQVLPCEIQGRNTADEGERHVQHDEHGLTDGMEGEIQQQKDQPQRQGHDDHQALLGALLVLELTTEYHGIAGRQVDLGGDALPQLRDQSTHVPAFHVGLDDHAALHVVAADLGRAGLDNDIRHLAQAHPGAARRLQHQLAQGFHVLPVGFCQAHIDIIAFVALDNLAGLHPANAVGHQTHDLAGGDTIAGQNIPARTHGELRLAGDLLHFHIAGAFHLARQLFDGLAFFRQNLEIRPEQLDRQLRLDAGQQFVNTGGDGLGEGEQQSGMGGQRCFELLLQFEAVFCAGPFLDRFEPYVDFHVGNRFGVAAKFCASHAAGGIGHFRELHELLFQLGGDTQRRIQAGGRRQCGADVDGAFFEFGNELGTKLGQQHHGAGEQNQGNGHHQPSCLHGKTQAALVQPFDGNEYRAVAMPDRLAERKGCQSRHNHQCHHQ